MAEETSKPRPKRIPHFGIQTYDLEAAKDFYCKLLNGWVVYDKPGFFATITFDEEHHRVALIGLPGKPRRKFRANPEIAHVAFEMADLETLLLNWERLRDLGITPQMNMNHGATLSSYYNDPDGNQLEVFVDAFPTKQECQEWFFSPYYQHNFGGGTPFDPQDLLDRMRAGATVEELVAYPEEEGMKVDINQMMEGYSGMFDSEVEQFSKELQEELSQ